jgi:hypothetical protein
MNGLMNEMIDRNNMKDPRSWQGSDLASLYESVMRVVDAADAHNKEQDTARTRTVALEMLPLGVGMNAVARELSLPVQAVVRALTSDSASPLWLLNEDDWNVAEDFLLYEWPHHGRGTLAKRLSEDLDIELSASAIRSISRWYGKKPGDRL